MSELADRAAQLWPLTVTSITLAAHRENAVYRVQAAEGDFALRLHRQGYRTLPELQSELQMMAMLEQQGVNVPRPLASKAGQFCETCEGTVVSVLSWMDGRPLGQTGEPLAVADRRGTFRALGQLIAQMHDAFDRWQRPQGFTRQTWDVEGLLGEAPQWGRFWDNPMLDADQRALMIAVRQRLRTVLSQPGFDTGLIHADMVSENILVDGHRLTVIDFDDSGFGFRLQDLATALVKHQREPDFADLRQALIEGYGARKTVAVADIELFLLMRHLTYLGWILPRVSGAAGRERSAAYIAEAVPRAKAFMEASGA